MNFDQKPDRDSKNEQAKASREAWEEAADALWSTASKQLSVSLRYLFAALNSLKKKSDPRFRLVATDGEYIYHNPMKLVMHARQGQVYINRAYVHMLMHCIFPAIRKASDFNGDERRLWDIASDIHAEYILDGLQTPSLMLPESDTREKIYRRLTDNCGILSIENIYTYLHTVTDDTLALWEELFYCDDHAPWPRVCSESKERQMRQSTAIASILPAYGQGKGEERLLKALKITQRKEISYAHFLKNFMSLKEQARLDPDSFDPGYYNYGMTLYGNIPLIEELEAKEDKALEELLIVVDTSGSCAGDLIERFLNETLTMTNDIRRISDKTRIHLLMCDREVHSDIIIAPNTDVGELLSKIKLKGFGGTDFRPPFKYARELLSLGKHISGMIYFTDGYGLYPTKRPPWKSAFIFSKEPDFDDSERIRLISAALPEDDGVSSLRPPAWALTHVLQAI